MRRYPNGIYIMNCSDYGIEQREGKKPTIVIKGPIIKKKNEETGQFTNLAHSDQSMRTLWLTVTADSAPWVARKVRQAGYSGPPSGFLQWNPVGLDLEVVCQDQFGKPEYDSFDLPLGRGGGAEISKSDDAASKVADLLSAPLEVVPPVATPAAAASGPPPSTLAEPGTKEEDFDLF